LYLIFTDDNNESNWHKDPEGNIFNDEALLTGIGAALDGSDWLLEFAEINPTVISKDQLALICYVVSYFGLI
jgi:hypothetical protein